MVKRSKNMLEVEAVMYEKCKKDKNPIKSVVSFSAVHFILDGAGYLNGERLEKGQGFVTYADQYAHYYPDENEPWTYLWFRFSGKDEEGLLKRCSIPQSNGAFAFDTAKLAENAHEIAKVCSVCADNKIAREAVVKLLLSFCYNADESVGIPFAKNAVEKARRFIDENYYKKIFIEEIANYVGVERKYLRTLFVKNLGLSPKEYLMKKRIDRAKFLLERNDVNVSLVAFSVGYDDVLDFSRIFKKHAGVSPKQYREEFLKRITN